MICIIGLIVFGILGIFSASHRRLAKEAFDCVFRRVTFRKCQTGFDEKMRGMILGKIITKSPKTASFVDKHFELLSWFFTILMILSFIQVGISGYNFYMYGNCNGPDEDGFCVFDPTGSNSGSTLVSQECGDPILMKQSLNLDKFDETLFPKVDKESKVTVIEIGCYGCPYTKKLEPDMEKLREKYDFNFVFAHLPVKTDPAVNKDMHCISEFDNQKFWDYHESMFETKGNFSALGINIDHSLCSDDETQKFVDEQIENIKTTNVYGTPTVFIVGPKTTEVVVGPKPYSVYARLIRDALKEE